MTLLPNAMVKVIRVWLAVLYGVKYSIVTGSTVDVTQFGCPCFVRRISVLDSEGFACKKMP